MKKLQAVLLCALVLAVLAAADLGYNFFASLVPEINDGISVRGVLAPLLFSDHLLGDFWSRERFLNAFVAAAFRRPSAKRCARLRPRTWYVLPAVSCAEK